MGILDKENRAELGQIRYVSQQEQGIGYIRKMQGYAVLMIVEDILRWLKP